MDERSEGRHGGTHRSRREHAGLIRRAIGDRPPRIGAGPAACVQDGGGEEARGERSRFESAEGIDRNQARRDLEASDDNRDSDRTGRGGATERAPAEPPREQAGERRLFRGAERVHRPYSHSGRTSFDT